MNYINEVKKMKNCERVLEILPENKKNMLEDLAYTLFEEKFLNDLPRIIEYGIVNKKLNFKWNISLERNSLYLGLMFSKYLCSVPGVQFITDNNKDFKLTINLKGLVNYYYEELQRQEYLNKSFSEKNSREKAITCEINILDFLISEAIRKKSIIRMYELKREDNRYSIDISETIGFCGYFDNFNSLVQSEIPGLEIKLKNTGDDSKYTLSILIKDYEEYLSFYNKTIQASEIGFEKINIL